MRIACVMVTLFFLTACASQPEGSPCPETRPQVCTMEYNPTCGILVSGERKDYSSPCNACADDQVAATLTGACPE